MIRFAYSLVLALSIALVTAMAGSEPARAWDDNTRFCVVVNHEEQYSIWPEDRETPLGWSREGFCGSKSACLQHIEHVWTDMRPLSLRRKMECQERCAASYPDNDVQQSSCMAAC